MASDVNKEKEMNPGERLQTPEARAQNASSPFRKKRMNLVSVMFRIEPWKDEFLGEAGRIFGKSKSDFFRSAVTIIINRIVEKYGDRPELREMVEFRDKNLNDENL